MLTVALSVEESSWSEAVPNIDTLCETVLRSAYSHARTMDTVLPEHAWVSLLLADDDRIQALNNTYRGQDKPTNVLSFPSPPDMSVMPDGAAEEGGETERILGDIALARQTIWAEAEAQQKTPQAHLSHLLVHGLLHLLGHDHIDDEEAARMEQAEITILAEMNIANPYTIVDEPI